MLTVLAVDFTLTATPSSQNVNPGSPATYTVTLTPINGFDGNVSLQQNGCPGSNCSFNPPSVTPPGTSTFAVATQPGTQPGTYTLTITAKSGNLQHTATVQSDGAVACRSGELKVPSSPFRLPTCGRIGRPGRGDSHSSN